jgi:phytoene dehydrogenase-like protein
LEEKKYDAVIIGAGHNGLVCACYLARAGLRVRVLESRSVVGGAAVTEEFHPGFRNSVASYTVSLLNPKIIHDLNLSQHGLKIIERPMANFMPLSSTEQLSSPGNMQETQQEFAHFSKQDADRLPDYYQMLANVTNVLRELTLTTPVDVNGGITDMLKALQLGLQLRKIDLSIQRDLLDLFSKSAVDVLDSWFENEHIKALFAFDAMVGNYASPHSPGSAYVLLHHLFGEVNGKRGQWGHAIGGMGAITQAMQKESEFLGVDISVDSAANQVLVNNGKVTGVELQDGSVIRARCTVANVNPKLLYLDLMDESDLSTEFLKRIRAYKCGSGTFRMNVALSELPEFSCAPGKGMQKHHQSGIIIAPTIQYMEQAYMDARMYGWSNQPIIEMVIPSTIDDSLASPGQHVASLFCQHFDPMLEQKNGGWDAHRDAAAETVIDTVSQYAPNFKQSILGTMILSPLDLERKFGLIGGDIFHGSLNLGQLYSARPIFGHGQYRGPLKGLYMCGSGTHPGGGVTGAPGHNAAREIIRDLGGRSQHKQTK